MRLPTIILAFAALFSIQGNAFAQPTGNEADVAAIKNLAAVWQEAWNRRDAAKLASIMDERVTFVSVLGPDTPSYGRGNKASFQASHDQLLKTMFANSVWNTKQVNIVRFVRPDIAIAQVVWETTGDKVRHVKHDSPRRGAFLWVLEKQADGWRVIASQNTEAMPPLPGQ